MAFHLSGNRSMRTQVTNETTITPHRRTVLPVRAHAGFGSSGGESKCPFRTLLDFGSPAPRSAIRDAATLEAAPARQFAHDVFNYVPFTAPNYQGKWKMTMGLVEMEPSDWIEIDEFYEEEMALRRLLMKEKRDIILASGPLARALFEFILLRFAYTIPTWSWRTELSRALHIRRATFKSHSARLPCPLPLVQAEEANREMLELLADFLPKKFPDRFSFDGRVLVNHSTGDVWDLEDPTLDPLEASALLVQEDLCLMVEDSQGVLRFVSGAVLFPQRWSLMEKLNADMRRIHEPVPVFNQEMLKPVNAFMRRLTPGKPFWRANWTISDNPALFQPLVEDDIMAANSGEIINDRVWGNQGEPVSVANAGTRLTTRCERETLSRFPRTGAILFTIRTHQRQLKHYADKPDEARMLAAALRNLPPAIVAYKTIAAFKDEALGYLDTISAPANRAPEDPFLP